MSARGLAGLALAALPLLVSASVPLLGPHHAEPGAGALPTPKRLTVAAAILDAAAIGDPGALSLELSGDVVLGAAPQHAGYTHCRGRCQLPAPTRSAAWYVDADTRMVVAGSWTAPAGASVQVDASSLLAIRGDLGAPGGLEVSVAGAAPAELPAVLISADAITGEIVAGALPEGTALAVTATTVALIAD